MSESFFFGVMKHAVAGTVVPPEVIAHTIAKGGHLQSISLADCAASGCLGSGQNLGIAQGVEGGNWHKFMSSKLNAWFQGACA